MPNNSVSVGGWTCYDQMRPPADEMGNTWILEKLSGWHGGVDIRAGAIARLTGDGDFDGPTTRAGRAIQVGGTLIARDRASLLAGMDRLAALLSASTRRASLVVAEVDQNLVRTAEVRLDGPTMIERTGRLLATFSLALYSPDPARYGAADYSVTLKPQTDGPGRHYALPHPRVYGGIGSTGRVNAKNKGDARSYPVITFYGPAEEVTMSTAESSVTLTLPLLEGQSVTVDCAQKTVILGGASRRHFLSADSRWLALDAGNNLLHFECANPAARATVEWRDAWS